MAKSWRRSEIWINYEDALAEVQARENGLSSDGGEKMRNAPFDS